MKFIFQKCTVKCLLLFKAILTVNTIWAQTCLPVVATGVASINKTYFPGQQVIVNAGSTSVVIGAAAYGTIPVSAGDVLFTIQMQGAQINSANDNTYGDGVNGREYLNNARLYAGISVTGPCYELHIRVYGSAHEIHSSKWKKRWSAGIAQLGSNR
jgi:hypothetical protein